MLSGSHSDVCETTGVKNCGESGHFKEEFGIETESVFEGEEDKGCPGEKGGEERYGEENRMMNSA